MTDEYFNDLVLYNEPINTFFKNYKPLHPEGQAVVYILEDDKRTKENKALFKDSNLSFKRVEGKHPKP